MSHGFEDNSKSIWRTPLVRLNRITDGAGSTVLAKIKGRNPVYSVKCRTVGAMIWDTVKNGLLDKVTEIGERFLSTTLFEGLFDELGILA